MECPWDTHPKTWGAPPTHRILQSTTKSCSPEISPFLTAIPATALLVKATEGTIMGSPLTIFVPHAVKALLNSHHTKHLSFSHFTSYKIIPLTAPYITLVHYSNLNPANLLPSSTNESPPQLLNTAKSPAAPHDDLQKTSDNTDFSWFTNGSYLKDENC